MHDKGGPTIKPATVRREVSRVLNRSAHQLAEKVLAKALTGDSQAMLAATQLLQLGLAEPAGK